MSALAKARVWIGNALVRLGLKMLGAPLEEAARAFEVEDDEADEMGPFPPVVLSEEARRMVQEGQMVKFHKLPEQETPLVGSAQEQMMQARARREMGSRQ